MLKETDNKIKPENAVIAVKFEEWLVRSKNLEYVCGMLGYKTEDLKKDIFKLEERLGNYREMVKFREKVADLLEKARKLKLQGKEVAIIPANYQVKQIA